MMRRFLTAVGAALLVTSWASAASAVTFQEANDLLSAWEMAEAKQAIDRLEDEYPDSGEVEYLKARYEFFQGDYAAARDRLDQALLRSDRADWRQLRDLVASTHDVVDDYVVHKSPSGHFEIYVEKGKDEVLVPYAFEALEAAYDALGEELGHRPPTPIRVEVYPQTSTLAEVSVLTEEEIRNSGTIALCKYNRLMITSPKALLRGYEWVDTLIHEYVHYVINSKTENRVPIWMHEGLAKYLERRWRGPDEHRLSPSSEHLLQKRVSEDRLITFEQMHPSMAKLPTQEDAAVAFAEVYAAMEYLRERGGPMAFRELLDEISKGKDARRAFAAVLDTSFPRFERDWRKALANRPPIDYPEDSGFEDRLVFKDERNKTTELAQIPQPAARDHMHLGQMLQGRERYGAAVVEYRKATRLMGAEHPILQTRLAQSLLALGRGQEALDALGAVRESFPSYVVTWIQLGKASIEVGRHEDALEYLTEAARINPFDPEVHEQLAIAYERLGRSDAAKRSREHGALVQ